MLSKDPRTLIERFEGAQPLENALASIAVWRRVFIMALRGLVLKPCLRKSGGLLLVGRHVSVSGARYISHEGRLVIEDGVVLQGLSKNGIRFGPDVSVGANVQIRPTSFYGGPIGHGLRVGARSSIATGAFIGCSGFITIGDDVMLGPGVRLFSENHNFSDASITIKSQGVDRSFVDIASNCWIASGVTVTAGVTVGTGSVIAAGSVVTRDIPAESVAAGVPARVIRRRSARAS